MVSAQERTLTTHGAGVAEGVPDAMSVDLAAVARATSVADALEQVALAVAAIGVLAREVAPDVVLGSTGLAVWNQHDPEGRRSGVEARHSLRLRCPVMEEAGRLVDRLAAEVGDALQLEGARPVLGDPGPLAALARERAVHDARAKAEQLAALTGGRLGAVVRVVEGGVEGGGGGVTRASAAAAGTSFEAGLHQVAATVAVTWLLHPSLAVVDGPDEAGS